MPRGQRASSSGPAAEPAGTAASSAMDAGGESSDAGDAPFQSSHGGAGAARKALHAQTEARRAARINDNISNIAQLLTLAGQETPRDKAGVLASAASFLQQLLAGKVSLPGAPATAAASSSVSSSSSSSSSSVAPSTSGAAAGAKRGSKGKHYSSEAEANTTGILQRSEVAAGGIPLSVVTSSGGVSTATASASPTPSSAAASSSSSLPVSHEDIFRRAALPQLLSGLDGKILDASDMLCRVTGFSRQEIVDSSFFNFSVAEDLGRVTLILGDLISECSSLNAAMVADAAKNKRKNGDGDGDDEEEEQEDQGGADAFAISADGEASAGQKRKRPSLPSSSSSSASAVGRAAAAGGNGSGKRRQRVAPGGSSEDTDGGASLSSTSSPFSSAPSLAPSWVSPSRSFNKVCRLKSGIALVHARVSVIPEPSTGQPSLILCTILPVEAVPQHQHPEPSSSSSSADAGGAAAAGGGADTGASSAALQSLSSAVEGGNSKKGAKPIRSAIDAAFAGSLCAGLEGDDDNDDEDAGDSQAPTAVPSSSAAATGASGAGVGVPVLLHPVTGGGVAGGKNHNDDDDDDDDSDCMSMARELKKDARAGAAAAASKGQPGAASDGPSAALAPVLAPFSHMLASHGTNQPNDFVFSNFSGEI